MIPTLELSDNHVMTRADNSAMRINLRTPFSEKDASKNELNEFKRLTTGHLFQ